MGALTLSHIAKHFGSTVALNDVSLHVDDGEFVCLLGASGCGKTTLLRIIAGLQHSDNGDLSLNGKDLGSVPCHKRNIGMVFQSLALFPHLNVGRNVSYGLKLRGVSESSRNDKAAELLSMVGLNGYENRMVSSLSGGQRQRVAIARALALSPQLFLMDEPFSALDASLRERLQLEIKRLQQQLSITTIFVTHDQREAMALADRIVILNEGRIEQAASPSEIYRYPSTRYVAEFIGDNNILPANITSSDITIYNFLLPHPGNDVLRGDGQAEVCIRPEQIELQSPEDGLLVGQIESQRQVGALVEREIEINGHLLKQTELQNQSHTTSTGDAVGLRWDWSDIWVIPE